MGQPGTISKNPPTHARPSSALASVKKGRCSRSPPSNLSASQLKRTFSMVGIVMGPWLAAIAANPSLPNCTISLTATFPARVFSRSHPASPRLREAQPVAGIFRLMPATQLCIQRSQAIRPLRVVASDSRSSAHRSISIGQRPRRW